MDIRGKIKLIMDEQRFDSGFTKREFVITTQEQYPQDLKFELLKDRTKLIEGKNPGDELVVHFDLRGSEWQGRYYVNLVAWKIEGVAQGQNAAVEGPPAFEELPPIKPVDIEEAADDDLPF